MRRALSFAALALALASSGVARADYSSSYTYDRWEDRRRIELQLGGVIGGLEIGPVNTFAGGGDVSALVPITRRLWVRGNAAMLGFTNDTGYEPLADPVTGIAYRYGLGLRWRFAQIGSERDYSPLLVGFYADGGIGHQQIYWDKGGVLRRAEGSMGIGMNMDFKIGKGRRSRTAGMYMEFDLAMARRPGKEEPATCQVICDEPTPPYPWDFAPMFRFGFTYSF
jgi:hypothetical protein